MADIDLPVFSFRPNWAEGVEEGLAFLTDVIRAEEGAEQRRSMRSTPRRTLEADFLLSGPERTFYDVFVHNIGAQEMMIPLYWDASQIPATSAGVTDRLEFDTRWTEFAPGLALVQYRSALDYEVVEIAAVDDAGIDLVSATARSWRKGSTVTPLRRGLLDDYGSLQHVSASVATVSLRTLLTVPNPWTPEADDSPVYLGLPVFLEEPNWSANLDEELSRDVIRFDSNTGALYQIDPTGRATAGQQHRWFLPGRERLARFRDLLYRHRGRAGAFWLPTFKSDFTLTNSALSAATQIVVENTGFVYAGGETSGREHIAIHLRDGTTLLRRITSVIPGTTAATEKLNLDSALGLDLSPGQVRKISFVDTARFDNDEFSLSHLTNSSGLTEANAVFRTFKNTRDPAGVISFPIPEAVAGTTPCGVEVDSPCYAVPVFDGWLYQIQADLTGPQPLEDWTGYIDGSFGPGIASFKFDTDVTVGAVTRTADQGIGGGIIGDTDVYYGGELFARWIFDPTLQFFRVLLYFDPAGMTITEWELQWGNEAFPGLPGCDSSYSVSGGYWNEVLLAPLGGSRCALNTFLADWSPQAL